MPEDRAEPQPAAVTRHGHLAAPRRPGTVRVDMHSHTMWSGDATTTPDELAHAVAEAGLDVLCITDHGTTAGAVRLAGELPCRVVVGQELRTGPGEIMGLFLTERLPFGIDALTAARRIRAQGGLVYIPHPFDPLRHCLDEGTLRRLAAEGLIDVVEAFNAKTSLQHLNERAAAFAAEFGLAGGAGSDAHVPEAIGAAYVEMPDFAGPAEFLAAVHQGERVGHHFDAPRQWLPRIVPSTSIDG